MDDCRADIVPDQIRQNVNRQQDAFRFTSPERYDRASPDNSARTGHRHIHVSSFRLTFDFFNSKIIAVFFDARRRVILAVDFPQTAMDDVLHFSGIRRNKTADRNFFIHNRLIAGSNPAGPTIYNRLLQKTI